MDDGREHAEDLPPPEFPPAGERTEIAALYEAHARELTFFVLGIVRDPERVDDVLQATFSRALEHIEAVRFEGRRAWLFRVALHEALQVRRRAAIESRAHDRLASRPSRRVVSPEESLIQAEEIASVRKVLQQLPREQQQVVVGRIYEDKTFAEIARELNVPLGTVLTRMRLALKRLRRALKSGE